MVPKKKGKEMGKRKEKKRSITSRSPSRMLYLTVQMDSTQTVS
jgi:hypothetical protein